MFGFILWDPDPVLLHVPFLNFSIYWYSLFFAVGFYGAVLIVRSLIISRARSMVQENLIQFRSIDTYVEKLSLFCFVGMIIGARLGHVIFYDASYYSLHPEEIVKVWHGGLSSHGAASGLLVAIVLFSRKTWDLPYLPRKENLFDAVSIASAFSAGCIRCGNFFNQEIIGIQTSLPWAVIFGSPSDKTDSLPRHPVQLYEAFVSFALLGVFYLYGRRGRWASSGMITGMYLCITFISRMLLEVLKAPVCSFDEGSVHMGQLLSLPLIGLGVLFIVRSYIVTSK